MLLDDNSSLRSVSSGIKSAMKRTIYMSVLLEIAVMMNSGEKRTTSKEINDISERPGGQ